MERVSGVGKKIKKQILKVSESKGGPHSVMATTPDSHAGGPGFKSQ